MSTVTISKKRLDELLAKAGEEVISTKEANARVAERVQKIKVLLAEIKDVVEKTGIEVKLGGSYGVLADAIESVDGLHNDWNSSSYNC
jgi:hypothetical protein